MACETGLYMATASDASILWNDRRLAGFSVEADRAVHVEELNTEDDDILIGTGGCVAAVPRDQAYADHLYVSVVFTPCQQANLETLRRERQRNVQAGFSLENRRTGKRLVSDCAKIVGWSGPFAGFEHGKSPQETTVKFLLRNYAESDIL